MLILTNQASAMALIDKDYQHHYCVLIMIFNSTFNDVYIRLSPIINGLFKF